jgi:hypothetical protein
VTCSGLDAPRMTVEVLGFFATHASARALTVVLSSMGPPGWFQFDVERMRWGEADLPPPTWSIPLLCAASLGLRALAASLLFL